MSGLDLDPALRLQAHALLDRLVGEGATFSVTLPTRKIGNVTYERRMKSQTAGTDG